jgi:hypothetical protein
MVLCLLMEFKDVLANPKQMQVLTGLTPEEFDDLAQTFAEVWQQHTRLNWQGHKRQRAPGGGPRATLGTPEEKLFFLLVYFRHYPTQEFLGAQFGFGQPQANRWILRLTPLLKETLKRKRALPERRPSKLDQWLAESGSLKLLLDGTERPIRRPKNPKQQKACYSGRKKRHTLKNVVLTCQRAVQFLSPTAPGSQSDKRLAEPLERVEVPPRSVVISDTGFQGLNLTNQSLIHPAKKPKGRELNPAFRPFNRVIAQIRVGVEHVLSGVKRCRIVSDVLRHLKEGFNDLVMEVASGLHNFRESHRSELPPVLLPIQMN